MIVLKNVNKTYSTKEKGKVRALLDINISFPEKGLCLILGKSGSGKTTLLNILGGLDNKYSGDFYICNKKIKEVKEYDKFRKDYVSFVFQDFNLIDDLTVEDNLLLGYRFSSDKYYKKVSDVLNIVGLKGYEKRYPKELSGGEQQRIAVARALIKDSKILLADEPTGNLDKENSEEIYNLLKEISKEKLVILVSHNIDLGLKYADYIVELKKGEIVSNNIVDNNLENVVYRESKSKVISNKMALNLCLHELTYKKIKIFLTIFLMVLCFSMLAFTVSIFQYNHCDPHYHLIKSQDYEYFKISNVDYNIQQELENKNIENIVINNGALSCLNFMSKNEAEENGFRFYDSSDTLELSTEVYYISDSYLKQLFYLNSNALIDGESVKLNFEDFQLDDVIGEKIEIFGYEKKCGGIYYSPYNATNDMYIQNDEFDMLEHYENNMFSSYIQHSSLFVGKSKNDDIDIQISTFSNTVSLGDQLDTSNLNNAVLLDFEGNIEVCKNPSNIDLIQNDEIYISLATYNKLFNTYYSKKYLIDVDIDINQLGEPIVNYSCNYVPDKLNSIITINVSNTNNIQIGSLKNMKIKGIIFTENQLLYNVNSDSQFVGLSLDNTFEFNKMTKRFDLWVKTSTIENLSIFLYDLYQNYDIDFETPISEYILDFENTLSQLKLAMILTCVTLILIVIVMESLLLSGQVLNRKKEIGIFKALGARNIDIIKIYLYEIILISIPVIILSILFSIIIINMMNSGFVSNTNSEFVFIYYKYTNIPISILLIFSCIFFAISLPLIKIAKLSVIESIRSSK